MTVAPDVGYSGTPLPKNLGINPETRYCVLGAPRGFVQSLGLADDVRVTTRLAKGVDWTRVGRPPTARPSRNALDHAIMGL